MSFAKLLSPLKAEHFELKDARLHQYAGDKPGSLEGEVYYDPTLHVPKVALDASHSVLLTEPTAPPATLAVGETPSAGVSLKGMRSDAKFGLPGLATGAAHGFMSSTDKAKLDGATTTPTADALSKYDANGRLIVADAVSGQQAVNWQTMVAQITLAQQGLAEKDPCRGLFTSLPANTYNSGTKRITASANGALAATPDGVGSWQVNDRIFFAGTIGTGSAQAGPYRIVQVGSASLPFILERTVDFGGPGAPAGQRLIGALIQVLEGSEHGDSFWVCTNDSITLDTTVLVFRKQTAADVDNSTIELDSAGNLRIKDGGVTYAKMQNGGALSVPGRSANSTGVLADISATADGQVLRRSGTTLGFGTVANAGLANMAESTIKGRASGAGTGVPTDLSASQVRSILNVADGANAYVHPNHSGDVVSAADGATTIQPGVVGNSKLANVATATIKGRKTAGSGSPEDLTPADVRTLLNVADGANAYVHPNHSGDVVSAADGATTIQPNVVGNSNLADVATATIKGRATAGSGDPEDLTSAQAWGILANASLDRATQTAARTTLGIVGAERIDRSLKSATASGWYKLATVRVSAIAHVSQFMAEVVSAGRSTGMADNQRARLFVRLKQNNALTGAIDVMQCEYTSEGGTSFTFGYSVVQDDATAKVVDIYVVPTSSTHYVKYSVLESYANSSGNAPVFYEDPTPAGSQPTPWTDATLASTSGGFRATIGNGSATSFTLAHGLDTADIMTSFIEVATGAPVGVEHYVDATNIVVQPGVVLPTGSLRVLAWRV